MKAGVDAVGSPAGWRVIAWVAALVLSLTGAARAASPAPLGAVLTISSGDLSEINNLNAPLGNKPVVLHFNTSVFTLSFSQPNQVRLPRQSLSTIQFINFDTSFIDQTPGDPNVATVAVSSSNQSFVPGRTLFILYPGDFGALQNANPQKRLSAVHDARIPVGGSFLPVVLVSLDPNDAQGILLAGVSTDVLQQLNTNIAVPPGPVGVVAPPPTINVLPPFIVNGDAAVIPGVGLRLTSSDVGESGAAWLPAKQPVAGGFTAGFTFRISNPGGLVDRYGQRGADGFAFIIQNYSLSQLFPGGGYLGYEGMPNSLAIEFDTWWNPEFGDPNGNHVSVHTGGTGPNSVLADYSLGDTTAIPNLKDGNTHAVTVVYQPGVLGVFIDNDMNPRLVVGVDLTRTLQLDGGTAWVGFTAGTGSAYETHDILSFNYSPS